MEPLFAALAGWWIGETLTMQLLIGGSLILAGVLLSELESGKAGD
jgi:drug/metabolite transporter (DMT)-like permease